MKRYRRWGRAASGARQLPGRSQQFCVPGVGMPLDLGAWLSRSGSRRGRAAGGGRRAYGVGGNAGGQCCGGHCQAGGQQALPRDPSTAVPDPSRPYRLEVGHFTSWGSGKRRGGEERLGGVAGVGGVGGLGGRTGHGDHRLRVRSLGAGTGIRPGDHHSAGFRRVPLRAVDRPVHVDNSATHQGAAGRPQLVTAARCPGPSRRARPRTGSPVRCCRGVRPPRRTGPRGGGRRSRRRP